jgi:hypothetical protein
VLGAEFAIYDPFRQNLAQPYDLTRIPKALVYRQIDIINHLETTCRFCVIAPMHGTISHNSDPMHIL